MIKWLSITLLGLAIAPALKAQNCLAFDGINDYAQALLPGPTGDASRTVEAWIYLTSTASPQRVILDWGDMSTGSRFTLNVINAVPRIEVGNSGMSSPSAISINSWHHIAATFDNNASPQARLYIDGVQVTSGDFTVLVYTSSANGIIIGRRNDGINYFPGKIDEVRVWDIAKSQLQIAADMNQEICPSHPNLVAYYKINQGVAGGNNLSITSVLDNSGNSNDATMYGFGLVGGGSNFLTGNPAIAGITTGTLTTSACFSFVSPSGNYTYTSSGVYLDTIPNSIGCDSVITVNLFLTTINTTVTAGNGILTSNQVGGAFQWLDCDNGYAIIPGATSKSFTPAQNGNYAVTITANSCTDTSACYPVTNVGLSDIHATHFSVSPNPATDLIHLHYSGSLKSPSFEITDTYGRVVLKQQLNFSGESIDISNLAAGVYFLSGGNSEARQKIIIR